MNNKIKCGQCKNFEVICNSPRLSICTDRAERKRKHGMYGNGEKYVLEISLYSHCINAKSIKGEKL